MSTYFFPHSIGLPTSRLPFILANLESSTGDANRWVLKELKSKQEESNDEVDAPKAASARRRSLGRFGRLNIIFTSSLYTSSSIDCCEIENNFEELLGPLSANLSGTATPADHLYIISCSDFAFWLERGLLECSNPPSRVENNCIILSCLDLHSDPGSSR